LASTSTGWRTSGEYTRCARAARIGNGVGAAAREAGVTIPLGAVVAQLVAAMVARGDGGLDHSGLLKLVEELSGRNG